VPEPSSVSRRYAAGAFELASEEGDVERWRKEMAKLDELLQDDVLKAAFQNPSVDANRRMELARLLAPELRPQTDNFLRLLIEHRRTRDIASIREAFDRLADEAAGITHVTLTTAIALSEQDRRRYEEALADRLGRKVVLRFEQDPRIIAGARILVGDHLVDGSVQTQLDRLHQDLLS
jgi:F-type H+-transporting ATPase subunit delta